MRRALVWLTSLSCSVAVSGCLAFDFPAPGGTDAELANVCSLSLMPIVPVAGNVETSTMLLTDDVDSVGGACTGGGFAGNDGFFAIDVTAGERWHIDTRPLAGADELDLALYIVRDCDTEFNCRELVDRCGPGREEDLTIVFDSTERLYVGIDAHSGGGPVKYVATPTTCPDGVREEGETCDNGPSDPTGMCDDLCRAVLHQPLPVESELNNWPVEANVVLLEGGTGTVNGTISTECDDDHFIITLPAAGSITAVVETAAGEPCTMTNAPNVALVNPRTDVEFGRGTAGRSGGTCGSIESDSFATGRAAGDYDLFVIPPRGPDVTYPIDYRLAITVTTP